MNPPLLLLVVLAHQGYWIGGESNTITLHWPLADDATRPRARLHWVLSYGDHLVLARGEADLPGDGEPIRITLSPPDVRLRLALNWSWQLRPFSKERNGSPQHARAAPPVLAQGKRTIHLFPHRLASLKQYTRGFGLAVWDDPEGLPAALAAAEVPHKRIDGHSDLLMRKPELVLVGPHQLTAAGHAALCNLARAGSSVLIFDQPQLDRLGELELLSRPVPTALRWREDHPLLRGLSTADLSSILEDRDTVSALQLPADAPVLALAHWPTEATGWVVAPRSALLAVQTLGEGRIIYCQLPLGDWLHDPRSQRLLVNALDYMRTQPGPTPSLRRRMDRLERIWLDPFSELDAAMLSRTRLIRENSGTGASP